MHHHSTAQNAIRFQLTFDTSPSIIRKRFDRGADFIGQRREKSPVCSTSPPTYAGFDPSVTRLRFCKATKLGLCASVVLPWILFVEIFPWILFAEIKVKAMQKMMKRRRQQHRHHRQEKHAAEQRVAHRKHFCAAR
jgi:hypothetical protein